MYGIQPNNIPQLKAAVAAFGSVWFHGDGNIFLDKKDSDFRQEYSNPDAENSKVRAEFKTGDFIPDTPDELGKLLQAAQQKENALKKKQKTVSPITNLNVPGVDIIAGRRGSSAPKVLASQGPTIAEREAHLQATTEEAHNQIQEHAQQAHQALDQRATEISTKAVALDQREADLQAREAALAAREKAAETTVPAKETAKGK